MWTVEELASSARRYSNEVWRVVEDQYRASTMRLTDSLAEQEPLEAILEISKPPLPPECEGLDYLLSTPFRYRPYPDGSRFRRSDQEAGAFYASENTDTAIAEAAFLKLLFFAESPDMVVPETPTTHTAFSVRCSTDALLDLTLEPLNKDAVVWTDYANYGPCQDLADLARRASIQIIRYTSVRDLQSRANVALLTPLAFANDKPDYRQTWHFLPSITGIRTWCEMPKYELEFSFIDFADDPRIRSYLAGREE